MQRLASKHIMKKDSIVLILSLWSLIVCSACSGRYNDEADRLNDSAYVSHYQSLDKVKLYADSVINNPTISEDAKAEALNNLAFYYIGKMQYSKADSVLQEIFSNTNNQIELCIANIQEMRLCQRKSQNKAYYEYRQRAIDNFLRIEEENNYTPRQQKRIVYAESEIRLVASVYDYYVGNTGHAIKALQYLDSINIEQKDTAQFLAYLYNIGSGGMLTHGTKEDISHLEYEYLMRCFLISSEGSYTYWEANALQALAEHALEDNCAFFDANPSALHYVNTENVPDSILAGNLAHHSLLLFKEYGDVYQQAAAWRTLSHCYSDIKDYPDAIYSLEQAMKVDTNVVHAPALMASIYELCSLGFSAMDMKPESDYYRNKYLDLYDKTRQDLLLEARAEQLANQVYKLDILIYVIITVAVLLLGVLSFLVIRRYRNSKNGEGHISKAMQRLKAENSNLLSELEEQEEELAEKCAMMELQLSRQQSAYVEQRAKMHHINTITPLLDRMLHETTNLLTKNEAESIREERVDYISQLIARINSENAFLTRWIQLKQGELSLHVESFPLQKLFDFVNECRNTYARQGITLNVEPTSDSVKADRTLTLFMLNTLCDNARKFTPEGGSVSVFAQDVENDMIEISIKDTGLGMTEEQCAHIFDVKAITDEQLKDTEVGSNESDKITHQQKSHGFGLLNCKGIIEKYKKTNALFAHCMIGVESRVGEGTRFFFRLPRGVQKVLMIIVLFVCGCGVINADNFIDRHTKMDSLNIMPSTECQAFADSVYTCNVNARYGEAIFYAKRCMNVLNGQYMGIKPTSRDTLLLNDSISSIPAEVRWMRDSVLAPYDVIRFLRNEIAVAALALHEWELYKYNNGAYSHLFKEGSADNSLADYCEKMTNAESNSNVAICLLVLLLLAFIPTFYFAYYRYVILDYRRILNKMKEEITERRTSLDKLNMQLNRLTFEHDRLHVTNNVIANSFSAIKHETMYFPSRVLQLINDSNPDYAEIDEVAHYYRTVYDALAEQAQYNCRQQLAVPVLYDMMLSLMAKLAGCRKAELIADDTDEVYTVYRFNLRQATSRNTDDGEVMMKILTQIARDLGELYNLRRCGVIKNGTATEVTVPKISIVKDR